jgi:hypothetical protein
MLDDQVLSRITGTIIRGVERVATAQCLDLLGVGPDPVTRQKVAKRFFGLGPALALIALSWEM